MRNLYEDCKGYVFAWFISPPSLNLCTPQTLQMRSRFSRFVSSNYRSCVDGKIKALARTCGSSLTTHGNRWSGEDFLVDHGWPHMTSQCDMTDMTSPDSWLCRLCRLCHSNISLCIDYGIGHYTHLRTWKFTHFRTWKFTHLRTWVSILYVNYQEITLSRIAKKEPRHL